MTNSDLISKACATSGAYLALGNEHFLAAGASFVRNRETPGRFDSNHVGGITASTPAEIDELLQRTEVEFEGFRHRRFDIDPLTPPEFVAHLVLDGGYSVSQGIWLVCEGELRARPKRIEIREVLSEEDWAAYAGHSEQWLRDDRAKQGQTYAKSEALERLEAHRLKHPPVRSWLAFEHGEARAHLSSWPGENGVGMVEDLFTQLEYRHRGLATALIAHCVADARARGAGPVIIGADPDDTPKHMYANLGFRPLYVSHNYLRSV
jgi:GNAT superfamily N-acetyltransferase